MIPVSDAIAARCTRSRRRSLADRNDTSRLCSAGTIFLYLRLDLADQRHDPQEVGLDEEHTDQVAVLVEPGGGAEEPRVADDPGLSLVVEPVEEERQTVIVAIGAGHEQFELGLARMHRRDGLLGEDRRPRYVPPFKCIW